MNARPLGRYPLKGGTREKEELHRWKGGWVSVSLLYLTEGGERSVDPLVFSSLVCVCLCVCAQLVLLSKGSLTFPSLHVRTVVELQRLMPSGCVPSQSLFCKSPCSKDFDNFVILLLLYFMEYFLTVYIVDILLCQMDLWRLPQRIHYFPSCILEHKPTNSQLHFILRS